MLRTILFGMGVWAVVSVPVALLIGRIMAVGSASDRLAPALAEGRRRPMQKAA